MNDKVSFVHTTSEKLNSLEIENGQLIALSDKPLIAYDVGGVRNKLAISDSYTASEGTAESGVAASSFALVSAYNALKGITDGMRVCVHTYTVTPEANEYVAPYTHCVFTQYGSLIGEHGIPIGIYATGQSGAPLPCSLYREPDTGKWGVRIVAMSDYLITYYITYLTGITAVIE